MNQATYVRKGRCSSIKKHGKCSGVISCKENDDQELRDVTCSEKKDLLGKFSVPVLKAY